MNVNNSTSQPNWLNINRFEAKTTLSDKVFRVANNLIFVGALGGVATLLTGGAGAIAYASCATIGLAARKILATVAGFICYPATLDYDPRTQMGKHMQALEQKSIKDLEKDGYIVKQMVISKSGVNYKATLITHPEIRDNGKWAIHAFGNGQCLELSYYEARVNKRLGCNTLLMNGPGVTTSTGFPTTYQMGAGFEAGLQYLEDVVKATHIQMRGFSLGGGMMSEAVLAHDFDKGLKNGIKYQFISDRTFSYLSEAAAALVGNCVKPLFYLFGLELNAVKAARKLSEKKIQHIIVQNEKSDGIIEERASLLHNLLAANFACDKSKQWIISPFIKHNSPLPVDVQKELDTAIRTFFND